MPLLSLLTVTSTFLSVELCLFSGWKRRISYEFYHIDLYISQHWLPRIDFFKHYYICATICLDLMIIIEALVHQVLITIWQSILF